ncbi:hypothetical protein D0Z07_3218 [Hyphodiscus hymeniophilus]|uniref:3-carboxymuconate cyclase n=1 Tax=Hyphodiscus hymeniophilus TaxID=353542 RepID=A0A9P6VLQ1_9HELO|nr:hypothetical protein D0Z07_3218 [Hyphodiscus hymeniophilus]
MYRLTSLLTVLALGMFTSAVPLTVPLGATGRSLTISADGQSITVGNQTVKLSEVMAHGASCEAGGTGAVANSSTATSTNAKAIYFMTNSAKNSIVALKVAADGTLSNGSITATGGAGMSGLDSTGAPAAPDSIFSQGAVKVTGNTLVAVNPGSNTLSMFTISVHDPTHLTIVGKPVSTLGEFPLSVAVSASLSMACVANSGFKAGIACFSMSPQKGLTPLDRSLRPFSLNQTTPPTGPFNTVSQTFFNADSSALLTTVKGTPALNTTGFLSVFPVSNGAVGKRDVRSSPMGTAVLFGTALLPDSTNIFVTDASFGSATLSLSSANIASVSASTKIAGQAATCWATFSDVTGTAFVTDVGVNRLVEVDTITGQLVNELSLDNGNPGMIDLVSKGNFVYALSPGNSTTKAAVAVFDVSAGRGMAKAVQNFVLEGVADSAQGMTSF